MTNAHHPSKLKTVFMRAAAKKRRRELDDHLLALGDTLSATGAAAVEFAAERPGLSVPQKDRVAAVIADLDKMSRRERNLIKALVTEAQSEWPDVPADMPVGTQPDDMVRGSLYYSLEADEAERRWNRRVKIVTLAVVVVVGFLITWGLLIYVLLQMRP
jgi:hypothetical protein